MKSSDIAMLVLIASVSVMVSFFVVNSLPFFKVSDAERVVPQIDSISAEHEPVDPAVFNPKEPSPSAINPTVQTIIGSDGSAELD